MYICLRFVIYIDKKERVDSSSDTMSQDDCSDTALLHPSVGVTHFFFFTYKLIEFYHTKVLKMNICVRECKCHVGILYTDNRERYNGLSFMALATNFSTANAV